jgi:hypothetical protein
MFRFPDPPLVLVRLSVPIYMIAASGAVFVNEAIRFAEAIDISGTARSFQILAGATLLVIATTLMR